MEFIIQGHIYYIIIIIIIFQNTNLNTILYQVQAFDADSGKNAQIRYSISGVSNHCLKFVHIHDDLKILL